MATTEGPKHVGFILDGNRRYARRLAMQPWKGHEAGLDNVERVLRWCKELGVMEVTLYTFSMQNFKRSPDEVKFLMRLFVKAADDLASSDDPDKRLVRVRFIGRKRLLPREVQDAIARVEEETKDNVPYRLNVALAYGGREEVTDACREVARLVLRGELSPDDIDESTIQEHLYLQSEPDMIIRTSGEHRTSNFLIWQSWYSEWFFPEKMWPELEKDDFVAMFEEFKRRERRFGRK
ncbi:di-trans,poly-cis-decaprenylcistransferase [Candidatus Woesearchaeota archaeon]|nr:di-trans,poly-cis-decaprenylcistransferase [Candidatus Woesearchaeota archaeon]